jgi:hypothetical protein
MEARFEKIKIQTLNFFNCSIISLPGFPAAVYDYDFQWLNLFFFKN